MLKVSKSGYCHWLLFLQDALIFHSDRVVQYASQRFAAINSYEGLIKQSMSRKRNCWDNAVSESFLLYL